MRIQPSRLNLGRLLLVIVAGGAAAMMLIFLFIRPYLRRPTGPDSELRPTRDVRALLESGQRELREGNVHLALKELNAAIEQRERDPGSLNGEERRHLNQLRRQSDLLAHLLDNPLEDILQQALRHRNAEEWHAKFEDYRGRTVVFEDVLRQDVSGRPALGFYVVRAAEVEARVALEDLALLWQLPLDPPRRWLFGARLASCRREEGGVWVFRFEPESAVLLTDEAATTACCPGPVDDEMRAVLRRQEEWLRR
jgi:hypothetical protein